MKRFTTFTSLLILGTTLSYIVNSLIQAEDIRGAFGEEETPLYL